MTQLHQLCRGSYRLQSPAPLLLLASSVLIRKILHHFLSRPLTPQALVLGSRTCCDQCGRLHLELERITLVAFMYVELEGCHRQVADSTIAARSSDRRRLAEADNLNLLSSERLATDAYGTL